MEICTGTKVTGERCTRNTFPRCGTHKKQHKCSVENCANGTNARAHEEYCWEHLPGSSQREAEPGIDKEELDEATKLFSRKKRKGSQKDLSDEDIKEFQRATEATEDEIRRGENLKQELLKQELSRTKDLNERLLKDEHLNFSEKQALTRQLMEAQEKSKMWEKEADLSKKELLKKQRETGKVVATAGGLEVINKKLIIGYTKTLGVYQEKLKEFENTIARQRQTTTNIEMHIYEDNEEKIDEVLGEEIFNMRDDETVEDMQVKAMQAMDKLNLGKKTRSF